MNFEHLNSESVLATLKSSIQQYALATFRFFWKLRDLTASVPLLKIGVAGFEFYLSDSVVMPVLFTLMELNICLATPEIYFATPGICNTTSNFINFKLWLFLSPNLGYGCERFREGLTHLPSVIYGDFLPPLRLELY